MRNEVSYRPQRIKNFNSSINFADIINSMDEFWRVISPSISDKFSLLDTYLLRKLFNNLYQQINATGNLRDLIENAFIQKGIQDENLFNFLSYQAPYQNEHSILNHAALSQTTPLSIIARATLLLRVSIGLVSQLFKSGGINKAQLNFVWSNYAVDNGFCTNNNLPTDLNTLWFDIEPWLTDLKDDINVADVDKSLFAIKQRKPQEIAYLVQIHRAGLWGLNF